MLHGSALPTLNSVPLQRRDTKDSSKIGDGLPVALPAPNGCPKVKSVYHL